MKIPCRFEEQGKGDSMLKRGTVLNKVAKADICNVGASVVPKTSVTILRPIAHTSRPPSFASRFATLAQCVSQERNINRPPAGQNKYKDYEISLLGNEI